jgi:hypothetical protein
MTIWQQYHFEQPGQQAYRLGPLRFWIRRTAQEWMIGWERDSAPDEQITDDVMGIHSIDDAPGDEVEWGRWAALKEETIISLSPMMPSRPMVARPATPIKLPPGRSVYVFIRIPIWLEFSVSKSKRRAVLLELPVYQLSNTWFGDPVHGELCYSLATRARSEVQNPYGDSSRAMTRVELQNISKNEDLDFDSVCIRVPHLNIYESEDRLLTNDVKVMFKGHAHISDVRYNSHAPVSEGKCRLVGKQRSDAGSSFKRSFVSIQSWLES